MKTFKDIAGWQSTRALLSPSLKIGFVPTMGNLHSGHASLVTTAKNDNDLVVVSIFVNPTQFNQQSDFINYPKTLEADLDLLESLGTNYCLLPTPKQIYPDNYRYKICETKESLVLEGAKRPGHFDGVLTVVMRLFNLVKPHNAYFGEKDYQQYSLIRDMASAFFMDINIVMGETIRAPSKLALSSRNNRLDKKQLALAHQCAEIFHKTKSIDATKELLAAFDGIDIEYISDANNRRFIAYKIGDIRLIDNFLI